MMFRMPTPTLPSTIADTKQQIHSASSSSSSLALSELSVASTSDVKHTSARSNDDSHHERSDREGSQNNEAGV